MSSSAPSTTLHAPPSTSATAPAHVQVPERTSLLGDYTVLFKPRVSGMVLLTAAGGFFLGCLRSGISPWTLDMLKALAGIALVTCGSGALNQALERATDRLMPRTSARPMAQHRIGLAHGLLLGFLLTFGGAIYLAWATNLITGTLTLVTAAAYVGIYTPLKRITHLNTFIGAFPGALPPLLGWTAARGLIEWPAIALFAILFVWQFPHFMAIGWLYRKDYKQAGIRVTATSDPIDKAARGTSRQALLYALLMIPVAMWPALLRTTHWIYAPIACLLSLYYLRAAVRFLGIRHDPASPETRVLARNLLKVSVIYLPLLLAAMALTARGRVWF